MYINLFGFSIVAEIPKSKTALLDFYDGRNISISPNTLVFLI